MSLFDTIMATAGMPAFRRVLGDEVTYTPEVGSPISTWAIFSKISEYAGQYEDRLETRDVAKLPVADVPRPVAGDIVTINGATYRVGRLLSIDDYFALVLLKAVADLSVLNALFADDGATTLTADDGVTSLTQD
jgi:hypothetical protein